MAQRVTKATPAELRDRAAHGLALVIVAAVSGWIVWLTPGGLDFSEGFMVTILAAVTMNIVGAALDRRPR
jgi:hypothetical protein